MSKKTLIQVFLIFLLLIISFFTFYIFYKYDDEQIKIKTSKIISDDTDEKVNSKNLIKDLRYTSNNNNGDSFELLAEYGEPSLTNSELMFLKNVKGNIILKNKSKIKLWSDYANFNTKTFETLFVNNVKIKRDDEKITGNELYLVFDQSEEMIKENAEIEQNLIRISYDVLVKKPGYTLKADVIEIDLLTKNLKIFMNDKISKVSATSQIN